MPGISRYFEFQFLLLAQIQFLTQCSNAVWRGSCSVIHQGHDTNASHCMSPVYGGVRPVFLFPALYSPAYVYKAGESFAHENHSRIRRVPDTWAQSDNFVASIQSDRISPRPLGEIRCTLYYKVTLHLRYVDFRGFWSFMEWRCEMEDEDGINTYTPIRCVAITGIHPIC